MTSITTGSGSRLIGHRPQVTGPRPSGRHRREGHKECGRNVGDQVQRPLGPGHSILGLQAPRPEDPPEGRLHSGPGSLEEAVVIHPHVELGGCRVRPGVGGLQYGRVDHPSPGGQAERGS